MSGLILPTNMRPAPGERAVTVKRGKTSPLIFLGIENVKGQQLADCTLTIEQGAALVQNLLKALHEQGVRVEVDGKKVAN